MNPPIAADYDARRVFETVASAYVAIRAALPRLDEGTILQPVRQKSGAGCYVTVRRRNHELVGYLTFESEDE